ncbi:hypothetical protein C0Q70_12917 [Pomacea canaliculata]|uniref:G-protein coupled receptors family 1 profile domain-containing protein n=1 Tax=Pomacea canaliculata TaxID=400727 RepID=A0A2T7P2T9_POMCA|nr:hypothetical protein C0Q70_12917 [Pomacea canaliculata]
MMTTSEQSFKKSISATDNLSEIKVQPGSAIASSSTSPAEKCGTSSADNIGQDCEDAMSRSHDLQDAKRNRHKRALLTRTTVMMFVLTVATLVCYVPYIAMTSQWLNLHFIARLFPVINSVINPFIYSFCNSKFRQECRRFLMKAQRGHEMSHENSTDAVNWTEEEKNEQLDELSREAFRMLLPIFILCVLLMTIGIPGNILVFLVYLLQFQPSTARFFIKAMAICDLFTNTIAIPAMIWKISHLYRPCHSISCESISVATTFPIMMSSSLLICVAFDRWRRVCLPLEWQLTTFHAKLMLFATIPVTCIFVVPLTYLRGDRTFNTKIAGLQGTICDFTTDHHKHVYGILLLVYVLTLMLLLGLAYSSICLRLYQQDREFQKRLSVTTNDPCVNKDRISEDSYLKNDSTVQQNSMTSDSFMMGHFRVMRHKHQDQSMYGNYANDSQQNPTIDMQCNPPLLEIVTESKSVTHTEPLDVEKSKQPLALEASITQQQNVMVGSFPSSQNLPSTTPCPTPPRIRISSSTDPSFSGSTANHAEAVMPSPSLLNEPIFRKESSSVDTRQPNVLEVASTKKPEAPMSSLSPITTPTECLSGQPHLSLSVPEGLDRVFTDEKDAGLDRPLVPAVSSTSQPANVSLCDNPTENIVAPQTNTLLDSKPQSVIPLKHGHSDVTPLPVTEKDDGDIKGPRKLSLQDTGVEACDDSSLCIRCLLRIS